MSLIITDELEACLKNIEFDVTCPGCRNVFLTGERLFYCPRGCTSRVRVGCYVTKQHLLSDRCCSFPEARSGLCPKGALQCGIHYQRQEKER